MRYADAGAFRMALEQRLMRVTQRGKVTIPLEVLRALGIETGTDVSFELDRHGARLVVAPARAAREIRRMRGAGDVAMTTDEILALTRACPERGTELISR